MQWLVGIIVSAVLDWLAKFGMDLWKQKQTDDANKQSAKDQADKDMKKAEGTTDGSSMDDQRAAADDALSHL